MKNKVILYGAVISSFSLCLIVFSENGTRGAVKGLNLCYSAVIPALFPFMVSSLLLFDLGFIEFISKYISKVTKKCLGLDEVGLSVFALSLIGGYPVGAKLINKMCADKCIDDKIANTLLCFSVSSGPAFVVIGVGSVILGNNLLGYVLLASNLISALVILICNAKRLKGYTVKSKSKTERKIALSDAIVTATVDSCDSLLNICAFVVLFSTIIGIIGEILPTGNISYLLIALLEVTNGVALSENILTISFLLGFSGFCVHFQILAVCKCFKVNYLQFFISRVAHGFLSAFITLVLIKLLNIPIETIGGAEVYFSTSRYSWLFGVSFIMLSILFMIAVRKNNKII